MIAPKFLELAGRLDDCQLISYAFENKQVRFQLFHLATSRLYSFSVPTDTVHGRSITADLCSVRLIDLAQRLEVRHDRYFPPSDTKSILKDARDRVTLAYGRRSAEHRWLINLEGEYPVLSCLVNDLAEIRWELE